MCCAVAIICHSHDLMWYGCGGQGTPFLAHMIITNYVMQLVRTQLYAKVTVTLEKAIH